MTNKQFLLKNEFMKGSYLHTTVSDYLFCVVRDERCVKDINSRYNAFFIDVLQYALENNDLDYDIILMMLEIHDFASWLEKKLISYCRRDKKVMEWDVYDTMIDIFTEPNKFFKLFGGGKL